MKPSSSPFKLIQSELASAAKADAVEENERAKLAKAQADAENTRSKPMSLEALYFENKEISVMDHVAEETLRARGRKIYRLISVAVSR